MVASIFHENLTPYNNITIEELHKISDENILENIAKNAKNLDIREITVSKISNKTILEDMTKNDKNPIFVR